MSNKQIRGIDAIVPCVPFARLTSCKPLSPRPRRAESAFVDWLAVVERDTALTASPWSIGIPTRGAPTPAVVKFDRERRKARLPASPAFKLPHLDTCRALKDALEDWSASLSWGPQY